MTMTNSIYTGTKPVFHAVPAPAGSGKTEIEYASGLAATGKTTFIRETIVSTWDDDLIIIVKPTIEMCETTAKKLLQANRHLPVVVIHSENGNIEDTQETVAARIKAELQVATDIGVPKIIICCHQSFLNVTLFPNKSEYTVYWDEEFDPTDYHDHRFVPADQEKFIFEGCSCHTVNDDYDLIEVTKEAKDRIEMRLQQNDEITAVLNPVYEKMLDAYNEKFLLFVDKKTGGANRFIMCTVRNPEIFRGFKRVIMFGARFENSLLYQLYGHEKFGVMWKEMPEWKERNTKKTHHQPIEFYYAVEDVKHASRYISPILDTFLKDCSDAMSRQTTLYSRNKVYKDTKGLVQDLPFKLFGAATELPFGCYGLDTFKHCDTLVYFGSYNHNSPYYHWLNKMYGIENTFSAHHFYQSIMRLCLRNPNHSGSIRVYTPCLSLVQAVLDVFPNATVHKMDCSAECEKILYDMDKRHFVSENDKRRSIWAPNLDGYILSTRWLIRQDEQIPQKMTRNLQLFQKTLEDCGYQRKDYIVEKPISDGRRKKETVSVMAQFPDDFQKVLENENWKIKF